MQGATNKWVCNFCDYFTAHESEMEEHLAKCKYNPANEGCPTCGNTYRGDQDESNRTFCSVNIKQYPNVTKCEYWCHADFVRVMRLVSQHLQIVRDKINAFVAENPTVPLPKDFAKLIDTLILKTYTNSRKVVK